MTESAAHGAGPEPAQAIAAGVINAVVGSGSLITFPTLRSRHAER